MRTKRLAAAAVLVGLLTGCPGKSGNHFPTGPAPAPAPAPNPTPSNPQTNPGVPVVGKDFSVAVSAVPGSTAGTVTLRANFIGSTPAGTPKVKLVFIYMVPKVGPSQTPGDATETLTLDPGVNLVLDQNVVMTSTPNIRVELSVVGGSVFQSQTSITVESDGKVYVFGGMKP